MPRSASRRRSRAEWAGRIALACGVAMLGFQSVSFSVAQVAATAKPALANAIVGYDGRITAAHAASLISTERSRAETLAREALRRDPTTVLAATTLSLAAAARNDATGARRLLTYAQMLSRRNVETQLWSIEDASARGDVPGTLRWYDITLRTKRQMGDVLFPVLTQAIGDPAVRSELARTLAARPVWTDAYIQYAAEQTTNPQSTAALLLTLHKRGVTVTEPAQASVVNTLLNAGKAGEAWNYYAGIRSGVDPRRARDPRFSTMLETPSLFDWATLNEGGVATSIQHTREGGVFEFSAPASVGGPLLQQVQLLPPGRYRLVGRSNGIEQDTRALPYWTLACRSDGRELGRIMVPNSKQAAGAFVGVLTVPTGCPVQVLTLFAQPSDAIGGVSGQIEHVALAPTGPDRG